MADRLIASDSALTTAQREVLSALLDTIIPPGGDREMPSASDVDFLRHVESNAPDFVPDLSDILGRFDAEFVRFPLMVRYERVKAFSEAAPESFDRLLSEVYACYYQDARVLEAIGVGGRPPVPARQHGRAGRPVAPRSRIQEQDHLAADALSLQPANGLPLAREPSAGEREGPGPRIQPGEREGPAPRTLSPLNLLFLPRTLQGRDPIREKDVRPLVSRTGAASARCGRRSSPGAASSDPPPGSGGQHPPFPPPVNWPAGAPTFAASPVYLTCHMAGCICWSR